MHFFSSQVLFVCAYKDVHDPGSTLNGTYLVLILERFRAVFSILRTCLNIEFVASEFVAQQKFVFRQITIPQKTKMVSRLST